MSSKQYKSLALLNAELIQDEGHSNTMSLPELEARIIQWLDSGEYQCHAVLHRNLPVAYCIWREEPSHLHVRQLFTLRNYRGRGLATKIINYLQDHAVAQKPLRLDVLSGNKEAIKFYKKLGFELYSHTYQRAER
jgi:ribosomal protein S18 acetylase RimI-like enzyme